MPGWSLILVEGILPSLSWVTPKLKEEIFPFDELYFEMVTRMNPIYGWSSNWITWILLMIVHHTVGYPDKHQRHEDTEKSAGKVRNVLRWKLNSNMSTLPTGFSCRLRFAVPQRRGPRSLFRGDEEGRVYRQPKTGVLGQLEEEPGELQGDSQKTFRSQHVQKYFLSYHLT